MVFKILLVGCGVTGAIVSTLLKEAYNGIHVVVWDEGRTIGGRMHTIRSRSNNTCIADLGAQYITTNTEEMVKHFFLYESLLSANVLKPLTARIEGMKPMPEGAKNYVAPEGMSSLVKHFLSAAEVQMECKVSNVSVQGGKCVVLSEYGKKEEFDGIVFTVPIPQILEISGISNIIETNSVLEDELFYVKYSMRYVLAFLYDTNVPVGVEWDAKYIYDDDIFRFVSLDNRKRQRKNEPTACVFHTTVEFASGFNQSRTLNDIETYLVNHAKKLFPFLPEPSTVLCKEWKYSQVVQPYPGNKGSVVFHDKPLIIAGGDSFTSSTLNGCITSAKHIADTIIKRA